MREPKDQPPAAEQIVSPYEDESRYATKRATSWVGDKVHVTETCDDDLPHLITDIGTTIAPASDVDQLVPIQERLASRQLPPSQHVVDTGYMRTGNLVASQREHQIDLVGPMYDDRQWQAKDPDGLDLAQFQIDRQTRYRGLAKTHLQHVATATAMKIVRLADWLNQVPRATTRRSHFAALAPAG